MSKQQHTSLSDEEMREILALKACTKKIGFPRVVGSILGANGVGYLLFNRGYLGNFGTAQIAGFTICGFVFGKFLAFKACVPQVAQRFPNGRFARTISRTGMMVPDSKFDDAAGIYNPKQEAFPGMKDRGLGSDHRDSFADSHNNREYKGLDTNNMRTVENDIMIHRHAAADDGDAPKSKTYAELRRENRSRPHYGGRPSQQQQQPHDDDDVDPLSRIYTAPSEEKTKPKAPSWYDPPPKARPVKKNQYGDVIEETV